NISLVPYSPLARGLVTNTLSKEGMAADDLRHMLPRFSDDNWDNNQKLAAAFAAIAQQKNITPAQLALAWVLAQGNDIIPIPGTKKRKYLRENAGTIDVTLSAADLQDISALLLKYPDTGNRYSDASLKMTNL
ncbi:MAG TPA: aldo/keto reductase, partial [Mucilaginibacter sp.]|nr:aldo/keto reductase [Mucilaginibacter sp.]